MSSGMFRGKESSNRIELSQLVQDLLNFGVLGSLQLWGWGVVGGAPHMCTCTCMHMHARTCTHAHARMVNMIISCKWPPHWGNPWEFPMMSYTCACACTCMCMCVEGTLSPPPHPHPPTPHPLGGTSRISQNSIALELIEIFQFRLKI